MKRKLIPVVKPVVLPLFLSLLCFGVFAGYLLLAGFLTVEQTYVAYGIVYLTFLFLFYLFVRFVDRSTFDRYGFLMPERKKTTKYVLVALILAAVFYLVVLEQGFVFGFSRQRLPNLFVFGFFLFTSPLVAIAQEAVFRGYVFKKLATRTTLSIGLLVSSLLFALQTTNPFLFNSLDPGGAVQYLFTNTFTSFALGIAMGLYFFKSGWSLLGPVIVRWGLLLEQNLSPIVALTKGWEFTFVFQLMGVAAVILLVNAFVKEPKFLARKYFDLQIGPKRWRFLRRARFKREVRGSLKLFAGAGLAVVLGLLALQGALGSTVHLVAIPTGSMRPNLNPGELVIVQGISGPSQIHVGDIVEYASSSLHIDVVHRVVAVEHVQGVGILFTTKGDNNTSPDPIPVPYSAVVGKVVFAVPYLGFLVLSPPLDVALVLFLFMSSVLSSSLKSPKPRIGPKG